MNQDKSSAEIERDIDQTRRHADMVLTELEQRLSPDRLMQDARQFFTENPTGREMVANLKASVVRNPLPLVITMVGLGWMMMEGMRARRPLPHDRRMSMHRRLGPGQTLDNHHMHVEDGGRSAHGDRGPTAEELLGKTTGAGSAAASAEAFKGNGQDRHAETEAELPSILGPDGQPLPQPGQSRPLH